MSVVDSKLNYALCITNYALYKGFSLAGTARSLRNISHIHLCQCRMRQW